MAERSAVPFPAARDISREPDEPIWLWRPFLTEPRTEIDAALERLRLTPIEDPSNDDVTLRRNALRHEIVPLLEARFPGAQAALARFAALAADDDALLEAQAAEALSGAVDPGGHLLPARLASYPLALQRRLIRHWVIQATGLPFLSAERTEAILTLAGNREGGKMVEIGEGWAIHRERGWLTADRDASGSPERES